jgi:hypothetical protein
MKGMTMKGTSTPKEQNDRRENHKPIDRGDRGANLVGVIYGNLILWEL